MTSACRLICIWLTAGNTYSTGSSIVITFSSLRLISASVAYRVVVLPEPVGPLHTIIPYGLRTIDRYRSYVGSRHAELGQLLHRAALVEQPQHRGLAPDGRAGRDAHVDADAVDRHLELAVLRTPALDDVHLGHDLDAADQLGAGRRRKAEHLAQRTVDPVADADPPVGRLDVDVGRAVAQRLGDDLVDELDDRRVVGGADDRFDLLLARRPSPRTA